MNVGEFINKKTILETVVFYWTQIDQPLRKHLKNGKTFPKNYQQKDLHEMYQFQFFQFSAVYCSTKARTTEGLDQMHNCVSRVFTHKAKIKILCYEQ